LKWLIPSLARYALAASLFVVSAPLLASDSPTQQPQQPPQQQDSKCHWWQFGRCDPSPRVEGLPSDAPREGTLITIDLTRNRAYLFKDGEMVDVSPVATGSEKVLKKSGKIWLFHTPRGRVKVLRKIVNPIWTKPDWAFVEKGEPVPPPDSPLRQVKGHLGKYALDLGDGIMIHGTDEVGSFGKNASHGCIRVPGDMLEELYNAAKVGTDVYIFESEPALRTASSNGKPERHSDLDF
jgi:lipoprotein-anchoring transpeptidase ErfK/SrfK